MTDESSKRTSEREVVAVFAWLQEALIAKSALEAHGIQAYIPEQHIATINPGIVGMQVHLQVDGGDLERAKRVLTQLEPLDAENSPEIHDGPRCPRCGSENITLAPAITKNWFRFLAGLLFLIPLRRAEDHKICGDCKLKLK